MPSRARQNTTILVFDKNVQARQDTEKYHNICKHLIDKNVLALFVCAHDTTK